MSIEGGREFRNFDSKNVVAGDALSAAKKVRLTKNKRVKKMIESIELLHEIDKP